jgi:hypothetical protein
MQNVAPKRNSRFVQEQEWQEGAPNALFHLLYQINEEAFTWELKGSV